MLTFSGVQDHLNDLVDEIERRIVEAEEKKKQEVEEAARKNSRERASPSSFLQWKAKFDAELEALKSFKQKQLGAAMKGLFYKWV